MMACYMEDDTMVLNHDDEFDARTYQSRMKDANGKCCCCLRRHIAKTHRFKNVQVPPIAHMNIMFNSRRCVQSPPELIRSKNSSSSNLQPLDLSVHSLTTPVHNEHYENSSDTGFDSPEIAFGCVPVTRPDAIQPIVHTFRASTPQANRFDSEPTEPLPSFQSVDQVQRSPALSQTNSFILEPTEKLPSFSVFQMHRNPALSPTNNMSFQPLTEPSLQSVDQAHRTPDRYDSKLELDYECDEDAASDKDDIISLYADSNG